MIVMNNSLATVLIVEDDLDLAEIYRGHLSKEAVSVSHISSARKAIEAIETQLPDLVLLDLQLPDGDGMDILRHVHDSGIPSAVVIMTGNGSMEDAVLAMRYGAKDFLEKPFNGDRLRATVRNALELHHLSGLVSTYEEEFLRDQFHGFVGNSLAMQMVYRLVEASAPSSATVLILGESGTGKELCAEAIHQHGPRRNKPFVAVNCAAIPADLIESELFGHRRGAFTGAVNDHEGAVSRADGGVLFLDEIAEMHLDLQSKLLRFLQTGKFFKVGGKTEETVDVRIVCATNRDPLNEVKRGRFREDLYYRLNVVPITLPALRERDGDILRLAEHFLKLYTAKEGKRFRQFSPAVQSVLDDYQWPGNVRQLQNVVHNITVLHDGDVVDLEHLPPPLDNLMVPASTQAAMLASGELELDEITLSNIRPLADIEREAIQRALAICNDNVPKAAALLDVHPSTIYRKKQGWT